MDGQWLTIGSTFLVAALVAIPCAIVGCYLVLRRLSLLGDAISHAVLPGIVLVYLHWETRTGLPLLIGAVLTGVLTAVLTSWVTSISKVREEASMGIVFTGMFALGVLLLTTQASQVDLDPGCVLYGQLELAPFQVTDVYGIEMPAIVPRLVVVISIVVLFFTLAWKQIQTVAFDAAFATALGMSVPVIHYAMMGLTAMVTVASFEAVGSILVIAMLIVPPATAQLLVARFHHMLIVSALLGVLAAAGGIALGYWTNTNYAGMMAVVTGIEFTLAVLFSPRSGLVLQAFRNRRLSWRMVSEDVLALLYRREEESHATPGVEVRHITGRWQRRLVLAWLRWQGWIIQRPGQLLELTDAGRRRAASLVRAHRLWEAYLHSEMALPPDHLHESAEFMEHFLDDVLQQQVQEAVGHPKEDPHGRPIPPGNG